MYTSLQNTGDVEAQSQSRPAPPPRRPAYDPLNELFGGFIPERYRNILGSNVQPLALTLLAVPTLFAWLVYAIVAPAGEKAKENWWPWTMYVLFAPMLATEVALCLLQVVRRYAGDQYLGCFRCIGVLEAAGAAVVCCLWFFVACILTASFLMVIDVGPGPFFVFQVLFSVGAWAMVIIAAYLSGLYLSEAFRGRPSTSSYSQLRQTDGPQALSQGPQPQPLTQYHPQPPAPQPPAPQPPQYQSPASYQPHTSTQAQASQYVPPTAL